MEEYDYDDVVDYEDNAELWEDTDCVPPSETPLDLYHIPEGTKPGFVRILGNKQRSPTLYYKIMKFKSGGDQYAIQKGDVLVTDEYGPMRVNFITSGTDINCTFLRTGYTYNFNKSSVLSGNVVDREAYDYESHHPEYSSLWN